MGGEAAASRRTAMKSAEELFSRFCRSPNCSCPLPALQLQLETLCQYTPSEAIRSFLSTP